MTKSHIISTTILLTSLLAFLPSCERTKEELGLSRRTPDEFMVMKRAPLEIPENLNSLPVPQPGIQRPQETAASSQAKQAIIGADKITYAESQSAAEKKLLEKTGATETSDAIRATVNRESVEEVEDKRPVIKKLLNIGENKPPVTIVDPVKESERLQQNKKTGQPVTNGETPTIYE